MEYKVDDAFLDEVDALLDSIADMCQATDTLESSGVAIVNIQKWEAMRNKASKVLDSIDDGFESAEGEKENEKDTEECTDDCDSNPASVFDDPDGAGCDSGAD